MSDSATTKNNPKRRRGPRVKHVPQRTCIVCRETDAKRGLTRIVRIDDGQAVVDLTGKQNGRGAYLCAKPDCWQRAVETGVLSRALRTELSAESLKHIADVAAEMTHSDLDSTAARQEEPSI